MEDEGIGYGTRNSRVEQLVWTTHSVIRRPTSDDKAEYDGKRYPSAEYVRCLYAYKLSHTLYRRSLRTTMPACYVIQLAYRTSFDIYEPIEDKTLTGRIMGLRKRNPFTPAERMGWFYEDAYGHVRLSRPHTSLSMAILRRRTRAVLSKLAAYLVGELARAMESKGAATCESKQAWRARRRYELGDPYAVIPA